VSADHIRWGLYPFAVSAPSPLADTLNARGRVTGGRVDVMGWGWKCGGCGEALEAEEAELVEMIPSGVTAPGERFRAGHRAHAAWVNHPDYCNIRAGGACSCGVGP
jgi:hypothetical protein